VSVPLFDNGKQYCSRFRLTSLNLVPTPISKGNDVRESANRESESENKRKQILLDRHTEEPAGCLVLPASVIACTCRMFEALPSSIPHL
jgi:hypothetical protein